MTRIRRSLLVALGVLALAVPAAAVANHGESHGKGKGKGQGKAKGVAYVFKGTYAGESKVDVTKGNSRVRKGGFIGETVEFDLTDARFVVADGPDEDTDRDLDDVVVGDKVLVKAKLPRQDPGAQPFDAQRLVDQTHPPTETE